MFLWEEGSLKYNKSYFRVKDMNPSENKELSNYRKFGGFSNVVQKLVFPSFASVQLHQLLSLCQGNGRGREWNRQPQRLG